MTDTVKAELERNKELKQDLEMNFSVLSVSFKLFMDRPDEVSYKRILNEVGLFSNTLGNVLPFRNFLKRGSGVGKRVYVDPDGVICQFPAYPDFNKFAVTDEISDLLRFDRNDVWSLPGSMLASSVIRASDFMMSEENFDTLLKCRCCKPVTEAEEELLLSRNLFQTEIYQTDYSSQQIAKARALAVGLTHRCDSQKDCELGRPEEDDLDGLEGSIP